MLTPDTILHGRYRIVRLLAQGGMGAVYEAIDQRLRSTVALKQTLVTGEEFSRAFEHEAQLLANLRHPALTKMIDHFIEPEGQFLVMEFIPGDDLATIQTQRGGPFPVDDVVRWAHQLLDALDYLHSQTPPIIHRDIKPLNLKLTARNEIILLDFGLAKGNTALQTHASGNQSLYGYTPQYAPLEQIRATGTDPRSDLYSLAATLYHLITNVQPVNALERASDVIGQQPDPLPPADTLNRQVSPALSVWLMRGMALNPAQRFASAAEMRAALNHSLHPAAFAAPPAPPMSRSQPTEIGAPPVPTTSHGQPTQYAAPPSAQYAAPQQYSTPSTPYSQPHYPASPPVFAAPRRRRIGLWLALAAGLIAVALVGFFLTRRNDSPPISQTAPTATNGAAAALEPVQLTATAVARKAASGEDAPVAGGVATVGGVVAVGDTITGAIAQPKQQNVYTLSAAPGQMIYFEAKSYDKGMEYIKWKLVDSQNTLIFDEYFVSVVGLQSLALGGEYTLTVGSDQEPATGAYELRLHNVPPFDTFAITLGDRVDIEDGVPAAGAGVLEGAGMKDVYTFSAAPNQQVFFQVKSYNKGMDYIKLKLVDADDTVVFDEYLVSPVGVQTLQLGGEYTLIVGEDRDPASGAYEVRLYNVPSANEFAITLGDRVAIEDGAPAAGAGVIESPGVKDVYTFSATKNQQVFFQLPKYATGMEYLKWKLVDADDTVVFDEYLVSPVGVQTLQLGGEYTLIVGEDRDPATGAYQLRLYNVPPADTFATEIGAAFAGTIESPGAKDVYTFSATPGQRVDFQIKQKSTNMDYINWKLVDANDAVVFDNYLASTSGVQTLELGGEYTLTVGSDKEAATGTYELIVQKAE